MQKVFEVSHHSATNARLCWQKYKYIAIDKLQPKKKARPLALGTSIHDCFDKYYLGQTRNDILHDVEKNYDAQISVAAMDEVEDLIVDKYTCLGAFEFYPEDLIRFDLIESEKEFRAKLWGNIWLVGRIDGLVHDKKTDTWWVREMKITSLSMQQLFARAQVSYQVSGYKFGIESPPILRPVAGVLYDAIKKPLLRKRMTEDAEAFGKRIRDDYKMTLTDPDRRSLYYKRQEVYRNEFQMECFKMDTRKLAREIRRKIDNNGFYRNPDACWSFNRVCEFEPICWAKNPNQQMIDAYYDKRVKPPAPVQEIEVEGLPF